MPERTRELPFPRLRSPLGRSVRSLLDLSFYFVRIGVSYLVA